MANLKNITELPVAESVEGLNLIVNDNGAAKQIPVSAVDGKVKTVNSISPDINGNVQIDTASSWNDLKDKPFYTETDENGNETVHKLDAKYLPDVGGGGGVPTYYVLWDRTNNDAVSASEGMYDALQKPFDAFEPVNVVVFEKTNDGTIRNLAVDSFYPNVDAHQVNTAQGTIFFIAKDGNHSFYND